MENRRERCLHARPHRQSGAEGHADCELLVMGAVTRENGGPVAGSLTNLLQSSAVDQLAEYHEGKRRGRWREIEPFIVRDVGNSQVRYEAIYRLTPVGRHILCTSQYGNRDLDGSGVAGRKVEGDGGKLWTGHRERNVRRRCAGPPGGPTLQRQGAMDIPGRGNPHLAGTAGAGN